VVSETIAEQDQIITINRNLVTIMVTATVVLEMIQHLDQTGVILRQATVVVSVVEAAVVLLEEAVASDLAAAVAVVSVVADKN
jgi:hypothetical protein